MLFKQGDHKVSVESLTDILNLLETHGEVKLKLVSGDHFLEVPTLTLVNEPVITQDNDLNSLVDPTLVVVENTDDSE